MSLLCQTKGQHAVSLRLQLLEAFAPILGGLILLQRHVQIGGQDADLGLTTLGFVRIVAEGNFFPGFFEHGFHARLDFRGAILLQQPAPSQLDGDKAVGRGLFQLLQPAIDVFERYLQGRVVVGSFQNVPQQEIQIGNQMARLAVGPRYQGSMLAIGRTQTVRGLTANGLQSELGLIELGQHRMIRRVELRGTINDCFEMLDRLLETQSVFFLVFRVFFCLWRHSAIFGQEYGQIPQIDVGVWLQFLDLFKGRLSLQWFIMQQEIRPTPVNAHVIRMIGCRLLENLFSPILIPDDFVTSGSRQCPLDFGEFFVLFKFFKNGLGAIEILGFYKQTEERVDGSRVARCKVESLAKDPFGLVCLVGRKQKLPQTNLGQGILRVLLDGFAGQGNGLIRFPQASRRDNLQGMQAGRRHPKLFGLAKSVPGQIEFFGLTKHGNQSLVGLSAFRVPFQGILESGPRLL